MEEFIKISKVLRAVPVSGQGWWYRAEVRNSDGEFGLGYGVEREAAVRSGFQDLAVRCKHKPVVYSDKLGKDSEGRLVVVDGSGRKYVLRGQCWIRCR